MSGAVTPAPAAPARVEVPLATAVQAHGETIHVLALRPPRGGDIAAAGVPFRIGQDGEVTLHAPAIAALIVRLGDVPRSTVDTLSAADWAACAQVIMGFFAPSAATP